MAYTKEKTKNELNDKLKKIETLYNENCIKRKGKTSDTNEFYTEIIANELLRNLNAIDSILQVQRNQPYRIPEHFPISLTDTNRDEENFAKRITGLELESIGEILDYQINIKGFQKDNSGKIDLISFNKQDNKFHLIELKYKGNSNDTLLKTILEIYTYFKQVNKKILVAEYLSKNFILNKLYTESDIDKIKIVPIILLTEDCLAYEELQDIDSFSRKKTKALILALNIEIYSIELSLYNYL